MTHLQNQIVFITGASSGIGLALAHRFAAEGAKLLLAARREQRLTALADTLRSRYGCEVHTLVLDVRDYAAVSSALQHLPSAWQDIAVLINNAGLALKMDKWQNGDVAAWEQMIDTNIKGLLYVTREVLPGMLARNRGHVVNIGSIAGYQVYPAGNVYCATKFAVRALTEGLKMDVHGSAVRVTEIDPGLVETEFSQVRFGGDEARAKQVYAGMTPLTGEDIADVVHFCVTRPAHVNIQALRLCPTDQSSVQLVHRRGE